MTPRAASPSAIAFTSADEVAQPRDLVNDSDVFDKPNGRRLGIKGAVAIGELLGFRPPGRAKPLNVIEDDESAWKIGAGSGAGETGLGAKIELRGRPRAESGQGALNREALGNGKVPARVGHHTGKTRGMTGESIP